MAAIQVERVHALAVEIELELAVRGVADADRSAALVPPSHGSSYSESRRSPVTPYMICACEGMPATARKCQSRAGERTSTSIPASLTVQEGGRFIR
jgi:hypothetical protein